MFKFISKIFTNEWGEIIKLLTINTDWRIYDIFSHILEVTIIKFYF